MNCHWRRKKLEAIIIRGRRRGDYVSFLLEKVERERVRKVALRSEKDWFRPHKDKSAKVCQK